MIIVKKNKKITYKNSKVDEIFGLDQALLNKGKFAINSIKDLDVLQ